MEKYLKEIGEERIIKDLAKRFSAPHPRLIKSIGDDTSVATEKAGKVLLATTDVLIEDTHFKKSYTPPYLLGRKSLSISLSDIAAMGGTPLFFLVSVGLPADTKKSFLDELYKGISDCAREFGCVLAGGNTARDVHITISTTVLGEMDRNDAVYRSSARAGDTVYVTGTPGDSALGLMVLQNHGTSVLKGPFKKAALRHLDPAPRMRAGRLLAKERLAHSMIDVSDGVALDLKRICDLSGVGAIIEAERLPLSGELKKYSEVTGKSPLNFALSGGEDYELLFTASERDSKEIALLSKRLKLPMTPIGKIVKGRGVKILEAGRPLKLNRLGFEHF